MKKMLGKIGAAVLAVITALSAVPAIPAQAAGDQEETLSFYISLTGSGAEAGENGIFYDD